jgi:hypothetical protein
MAPLALYVHIKIEAKRDKKKKENKKKHNIAYNSKMLNYYILELALVLVLVLDRCARIISILCSIIIIMLIGSFV